MRDLNVYNFKRALPRMSWHPHNLYNLWRRSYGPLEQITNRVEYKETLNWRRWTAKSLLRGYHGDFINEKIFKRWYLPETLPDVRPSADISKKVDAATALEKWAKRDDVAQKASKRAEAERRKGLAPVGSLMFTEVERRIDVVIFRACFAHSVYEARRLVIHGDVLLNGNKHTNPNTRLAPGDMVSVDPKAIRFLQHSTAPKAKKKDAEEQPDAQPEEEKTEKDEIGTKEALRWETPCHIPPYASPFLFIPAYLEVSFMTCSAIYLRHPTARPGYSEVPTPWDADGEIVRLTWEWYSKRRMRIRSKSQLARMPENRQ